jgi:hypothetical protein
LVECDLAQDPFEPRERVRPVSCLPEGSRVVVFRRPRSSPTALRLKSWKALFRKVRVDLTLPITPAATVEV